jgi:ketosteroid isomerase-like protein
MKWRFEFVAVLFPTMFAALGQTSHQLKESDTATLQRIEHNWADAFVHKDQAALGRILAPEWRGQYPWGNEDRAEALAAVVSGTANVESMTLGKMKVRVLGDIAFIMGSDDEKSTYAGKDTSGHFSWTDIYARRNGRWRAIASQLTPQPHQ